MKLNNAEKLALGYTLLTKELGNKNEIVKIICSLKAIAKNCRIVIRQLQERRNYNGW
jgi:hypothetical protein